MVNENTINQTNQIVKYQRKLSDILGHIAKDSHERTYFMAF